MELRFVVTSNTDQGQCVANQHGLDALVEGGRAAKGRHHVDFKYPRFEVGVHDNVKSVKLEAVVARCRVLLKIGCNCRFYRHQGLHDKVLELGMHILVVDAALFVVCLKHFEVPIGWCHLG